MFSEAIVKPSVDVVLRWRRRMDARTDTWTPWQPLAETLVLKEYDKFEISWTGPAESMLVVEGLDPLSNQQPLKWLGHGPLWLPGSYRISVHRQLQTLWAGRINVTSGRPSYQPFATAMIDTLESWIPGISHEFDRGVWSHRTPESGTPNPDVTKVLAAVASIRNVLAHPDLAFTWSSERRPQATFNTIDNRTVLKGLIWLDAYVNDRLNTLSSQGFARSDRTIRERVKQLSACRQQLAHLLRHPLWAEVDVPRASDTLTQRGYRRPRIVVSSPAWPRSIAAP